jgi:hypothetical protein
VNEVLDRLRPKRLYDLGGNVGPYSRLSANRGVYTVCFDVDPLCVHDNYEKASQEKNKYLLPLVLDLTNPTPNLGFSLNERSSIYDRGQADITLALALLHHLRITGNVPMVNIASFLSRLGIFLLIEYVPKTDSMSQRLLRNRKDTFLDYDEATFRDAFLRFFDLMETYPVADTERTLFLFRRK